MSHATARSRRAKGDLNRLLPEDQAVHGWYRFVLSFPPHLVRDYLERFEIGSQHRVLDPFCGTGTTLVECKKLGIPSIGIEANPMARFASMVKVDWRPDPDGLTGHARQVGAAATSALEAEGIEDEALFPTWGTRRAPLRTLPGEKGDLLLRDSISPLPLHKTLVLSDALERCRDDRYHQHELLALAAALTTSISNLQFGPEVGVGPARPDAPVLAPWLACVRNIADDLHHLRGSSAAPADVYCSDARKPMQALAPGSIDAVITSPPYPNEKDYTRTTRLESVLLGFVRDRAELRALKRTLVRSNTRSVYHDDDDDRWVAAHPEIQRLARAIEARRIELGKTSGFERQYARVTRLYFGGMARHLAELRPALRPGARLAYVVGDQASYLRVMIRTGTLLAEIAQALGYEVAGIDLFRTRLATATREQLREEVVVLRWPGKVDLRSARMATRALYLPAGPEPAAASLRVPPELAAHPARPRSPPAPPTSPPAAAVRPPR
jgi:DNA modification methylase